MKELRRQLKELLQQAGADAEVLEAFIRYIKILLSALNGNTAFS